MSRAGRLGFRCPTHAARLRAAGVPRKPTDPSKIRRGSATDAVFDLARSCTIVDHNWREGDAARSGLVADAREVFNADKSARMTLREDGVYVFVVSHLGGYTRYELRP